MSRNQRLALVLAAAVVAVIAFVVISPGGDDNDADKTAQPTRNDQLGTSSADITHAVERIRIRGGEVVGGPPKISVKKGDRVRIVVSADADDDIHLHGYDIEKKVLPGRPARFDFEATIEGQFEMESHKAEDEGREPLVANLVVEPS
jgi:FtsP/CotA-like multicopper oxidase with cupredoxin domain